MTSDNRVTGRTKLMGVIGNPIEHSISPQLHNTVSSLLGVDYVYVPFRVEKEVLGDAVKGLKALGFVGFNITVPFKNDVLEFLDEVTDEVKLIGAANTVKIQNGKLYGFNTDTEGFARAFQEETGTGFRGKRITILGAGGAARGIAVKVALEGAAVVSIINRTVAKAYEIAEIINKNIGIPAAGYANEESTVADVIEKSDIIINTTSIGMHPQVDECPVDGAVVFSPRQIVYDAIYNPVQTALLKKAERDGSKAVNGLGMLFYQGIYAYEIWTGIKVKDEIIQSAYEAFLKILKK